MRALLALGLMIATTIAVAAWARPSSALIPVAGRFTSVDESGRLVTIDTSIAPNDLDAINPGDARVDGAVSTHRADQATGGSRRRVLGVWLLAMAGTAVVLRARRDRTN